MTEEQASPQQPAPISAEHFESFVKKVDERFANLAETLHRKTASKSEVKVEPPQEAAPITAEDLSSALRLGEIRASLPEGVRTRVDAFREAHGFGRAVSFAETVLEALSTSSALGQSSPKSKGASPSPPSARALPQTQSEFYALAKRDPEAAEQIARDPLFDFSRLPKY
jgi:hypothetical protein